MEGKDNNPGMTQKEAIFDTQARMIRIETVLMGVPNTEDKGIVGQVSKNTRKIGKLEVRFWILIAFLVGSGVLGGTAIAQLIAA